MRNSIKYLCGLCLLCVLCATTTTSCEDMLSPDSERHTYVVAQDTLYSYWGVLKSLQNVAERYMVLGECRGELVSGTGYVSDSIADILDFNMDSENLRDGNCRFLNVRDYYHVINSCNAYLAMYDKERKTGTLQPYMKREAAQVEAIRAWTYLQMVQVYKRVPYFTEPKLTTDDISAFMNNPEWITLEDMIIKFTPSLTEAAQIELQYGLPQYETYSNVCSAVKAMIPLNLILGDIYLAAGRTQVDFEKAAEYYYNYLSNNQGMGHIKAGAQMPVIYECYGYKGEGMDKVRYYYTGAGAASAPWRETGLSESATSPFRTVESITAIPSSTNKLWGTVLRGVNELYGYSSEITVNTAVDKNDSTKVNTSASINLTPQYDVKQLAASQAYFDLCNAQNFELYIAGTGDAASKASVTVDTLVGDARQYWVNDVRQTYSNGLTNTEKFITKQNPFGVYSTVSHMIYRRSMVWLRYAEALNRAGYPSYAFAILKNGLCKNDDWYPLLNPIEQNGKYIVDFEVTDSAYIFFKADADSIVYPANVTIKGKSATISLREHILNCVENGKITTYCDSIAELDTLLAKMVEAGTLTDDEITKGQKLWVPVKYKNYPDEDHSKAALYYLDRREVKKSPSFLNFNDFTEFNGCLTYEIIRYRSSLTSDGLYSTTISLNSSDDKITHGIHSHGCGLVRYDDHSSTYNYVDQVIKKATENYPTLLAGRTLTKESIYGHDPSFTDAEVQDIVMRCVEDLIVDEEALELAFEGTRFFDLMRVAKRRNDTDYLASRLAKRNPALLGKLRNEDNWYFRLPAK